MHHCQTLFLDAFLDLLSDKLNLSIESKSTGNTITEKFIGDIPDDYSRGGYVDIYLKINQQIFLIENKIYAADQKNQIIKYDQHKIEEKGNYISCHILYLSLDGKCPTAYSCGFLKLDEHFYCISYKFFIIKWLKKCIKRCKRPTVKETIKGYLTVIEYLTNQTSYHKMQDEIKKLLLANKTYLNAAAELSKVVAIIKNEADEKIREINRLLNIHEFGRDIKLIETKCFDHNGDMVLQAKIYPGNKSNPIEIEISHDDGVLYCGSDGEFFKCKALIEPYKAEDFVNAFADDLNQKYSKI